MSLPPSQHPHKTRFFTRADAIPGALDNQQIVVVGYGCLGKPMALNLRDSMHAPSFVGNIADSYADTARADGFIVRPIAEAVKDADIVLALLPDEVLPEVYPVDIGPHLKPGAALVLASGYCLAYSLIQPSLEIDVLLLAPRMAGENARQRYLRQQGFHAYISAEQDASGLAWTRLLGLCEALGVLQAGALELSAKQEANLDLFIEQSLGAMLGASILSAFSVGMEAGFAPEVMAMEMYASGEMEAVWRSFREEGFFKAAESHGPTAMFGGCLRTLQFLQEDLEGKFREILGDIASGGFAERFEKERKAGYPQLAIARQMGMEDPQITLAEQFLRRHVKGPSLG